MKARSCSIFAQFARVNPRISSRRFRKPLMPESTKYAIVLPDGAADEPTPDLAGRTPLEAAQIPYMDSIVETGRIGTVRTVPEGFTPGSDVATMSLLGYDVRKHYTGRAPIEAVAQNVRLRPEDVVF